MAKKINPACTAALEHLAHCAPCRRKAFLASQARLGRKGGLVQSEAKKEAARLRELRRNHPGAESIEVENAKSLQSLGAFRSAARTLFPNA